MWQKTVGLGGETDPMINTEEGRWLATNLKTPHKRTAVYRAVTYNREK